MRTIDIGQQLRAFRLSSGLSADAVAARLGISRAALYRYEKGEVVKLDTLERLAGLMHVPSDALLGTGVEYHPHPGAFFERIAQLEAAAEQVLQVGGPLCYLTASDEFDAVLQEVLFLAAEQDADPAQARTEAEQVLAALATRKRIYRARRPGIIAILTRASVRRLLETGFAVPVALPDALQRRCRRMAVQEVECIARLMQSAPMGMQFGLLPTVEPSTSFKILGVRERASLVVNPFRVTDHLAGYAGVAMVIPSQDAVGRHQRVAEALWRAALKGAEAAAELDRLLAASG